MVGFVTKPYMLDTLVDEIVRFARQAPKAPLASNTAPPPSVKPPSHPMRQDITDWQAMQQYFHPQPQLLNKLMGILAPTLSGIQQDLQQARRERDLDALAKIAHNIKGTALNLHAPELASLAIQTQEQARQHSEETLITADRLCTRLADFVAMAASHQASRP